MNHIFLSYSRKDLKYMEKLQSRLEGEGIPVWTDASLVAGTPEWTRAIAQAIDSSACMIAMISPDANESKWVAIETLRALNRNKNIITLIIRGDGIGDALIHLEIYQRLDMRQNFEAAMPHVVNAVHAHLQELGEIALPEDDAPSPSDGQTPISWVRAGSVLQWFQAAGAAGVALDADVQRGDLLFIGEGDAGFEQRVDSIQRHNKPVDTGWAGQQIGLRLDFVASPGELVYKAANVDPAFYIGRVEQFYSNLSVVTMKLADTLRVGDLVEIRSGNKYGIQVVQSMQINRRNVKHAAAGKDIGLQVYNSVAVDALVYRVGS